MRQPSIVVKYIYTDVLTILLFGRGWSFLGGGSVAVDSLLSVAPIVGFCVCSMFCCTLLCVLIVLQSSCWETERERERAGCFSLFVFLVSCDFMQLFLTVPWVGLQCVIVVFSDHAYLLLPYSSILLRFKKRVG